MTITRITEASCEISETEIQALGTKRTRSTTNPYTGAYSWRFDSDDGSMVIPLLDATAARVSLMLWMDALPGGDTGIISFKESLTSNLAVEVRQMEDEQTVRLYIDGVLQDEDTWANMGYGSIETWYRWALVASVTNSYASVYLNGVKVLTYSGAIAQTPWDFTRLGTKLQTVGWANYMYMDDVYVDSMTNDADAVPPAYRFLVSYAELNGDHLDFTPLSSTNASQVDDGAVDDGDTTYNFKTTSGGAPKDSFETDDIALPIPNWTITAAIPFAVCRKLNAADDAQIIPTAYDGGTLAEGDSQDVGLSYAVRRSRMVLQPDGTAWDETDFNAMQFGYKAGGTF